MSPEFKETLGIALLGLYKLDKYFYNVAARLRIQDGEPIKGMEEVRGYTDGVRIYLTPAWEAADQDIQLTTLTHEVLHVISKHLLRMKGLDKFNPMLMNVAADLSIAQQQVDLGQNPPIKEVVKDWQKYIGKDMFEIYQMLIDDDSDAKDLGHPEFDFDTDSEEEVEGLSLPSESETFGIDQAIQAAAVQAESEGYSTAASKAASRQIDEMRTKPIRWDYYLRQVASRLKSDLPTWVRPNRRMMSQVYLPSKTNKEKYECTVAMDVSGSVGQQPLNQIASITQDILTKYVDSLHLMTFDDKIVDEFFLTRKDKLVDLSLNGYGGTIVQKVYDHLEETKKQPSLLIVATDGYIPKPPDPGYRVIWLIVNNPRFTIDYGTILHVNTKELP